MPRPLIAAALALPVLVATLPLAAILLFRDGGPPTPGPTAATFTLTDAASDSSAIDALPVAYGVADATDADCARGEKVPDADS
jgi:hypothetical protein